MRIFFAAVMLSLLPATAIGAEGIVMPEWAYPDRDGPGIERERDDSLHSVPGSDLQYTRRQVSNFFGLESWFPDEHPPMPEIVKNGRPPAVRACAACHLPNGLGHPSSGMSAGLPAEYFFQQVKDFASRERTAVDPERTAGMSRIAEAMTDEEIRIAADYFASLSPQPWVKVIESDTAPVTFIGTGNMRMVLPDGGMEPLGQRIVEVAEDSERTELRDPHSGFVAYVPVGSIQRGEALATTGGNGKTVSCAVCHGPDLRGIGNVPGIAGVLPTYVTRQMLDIKQGSRNGAGAALMKPVVAQLSLDDIINIAAYTASLTP